MILFYLMVAVFIAGYMLIVFEHLNKIDKAASALFTGALLWTILVIDGSVIMQLNLNQN